MTARFYFRDTSKGISVMHLEVRHQHNKSSKKIANLKKEHWNVAAQLPLPGCDAFI